MCYYSPIPAAYYGTPYMLVSPQYVQQVTQISDALIQANLKNWQLQQQMAQRQMAEEAYSSTAVSNNGYTYTVGKSNNALMLINAAIVQAFHVIPEPLFDLPEFYCITLSCMERSLILDAEHYGSDRALLTAFQECPGVEVCLRRTAKTTAELLRTAVSKVVQCVRLDYYAGWGSAGDGNYNFTAFAGLTTHRSGRRSSVTAKSIQLQSSAAATATAVRKFCPVFSPVRDVGIRWQLFLWFHAAALYSLLDQLSAPLPLGLSLFTAGDTDCATYLKALLNWYGDSPISLNLSRAQFNDSILSRKDQPLFILDEYRSANAKANAAAFAEVLITRQITWEHHRKQSYLPLPAMPVILSDHASSLSCMPEAFLMELTRDKFDREAWAEKSGLLQYQQDYLTAFLAYTEANLDTLKSALRRQSRDILTTPSAESLNEACRQLLGILSALDEFLAEFYRDTDPESIPLIWERQEERWDCLLSLLKQTSERGLAHAPAVQDFIDVTRSHLRAGRLTLTPMSGEGCSTGNPLVYYDQDFLCFPSNAFQLICQAITQSRPDVLRALKKEGLLAGAPANSETRMTRISVYNVYGVRETVYVYKVKRSTFEAFGDPLQLEGMADV